MDRADGGGSAFPVIPPRTPAGNVTLGYPHPDAGMTLRDYFAAKAMQSFILSDAQKETVAPFDEVALDAYRLADAMLKARKA